VFVPVGRALSVQTIQSARQFDIVESVQTVTPLEQASHFPIPGYVVVDDKQKWASAGLIHG
jgi:hypothetical protein